MTLDTSVLGLWPPQASAYAGDVDLLVWCFSALVLLLVIPIFWGLIWFMIKYHHGRTVDRSHPEARSVKLELTWTLVPFAVTMVFFVWAARLYVHAMTPPPGALEIHVVAKQWMWKFQHPEGQAEIDNLHVPAGEAVKLSMISQDVIHGLLIPALRIQYDVLPDRYTQIWFNADRVGNYRLYCDQFCGTDHSAMTGIISIMKPADYAAWLQSSATDQSLAAQGEVLFRTYGCSGCHDPNAAQRAPSLVGVYGHPVPLSDGSTVTADARYIRDSILAPASQVVAGYAPIMPDFKGQIPEDDLDKLIAYIEGLGSQTETAP